MLTSIEELFGRLLPVVEHLVNTHVTWNNDLSQENATGILTEVKTEWEKLVNPPADTTDETEK